MYLVPAAWGKGIGKQLMNAALGRLIEAGFDQVTLWGA
jgi:GNAT superfamily N-acetyltransferase